MPTVTATPPAQISGIIAATENEPAVGAGSVTIAGVRPVVDDEETAVRGAATPKESV
jgi:hypothetical protein